MAIWKPARRAPSGSAPASRSSATRHYAVLAHRWAGLFMALFLVVAGLTGAIIAWQKELDAWANPHWFDVTPQGERLPLAELAARAEAYAGGEAKVSYIALRGGAEAPVELFLQPREASAEIPYDNLYLDPYRGEVLGARDWGAVRVDAAHVIPLIYRIHYSLALPDPWGMWLFGAVALVWVFDCFVGAYLTLPRRRARFFSQWGSAWKIKWRAASARVTLDIHRAASLWLWAALLAMALSGVMFNLHQELYAPALRQLTDYASVRDETPDRPQPVMNPALSFDDAIGTGRRLMQAWSEEKGFAIKQEDSLSFLPNKNLYQYRVKSSLDLPESYAQTRLYFDADSGELRGREYPGIDNGNAISTWLAALHMGHVFGLWYRVAICVFGLFVVAVSVTGVLIWWRKRQAKRFSLIRKLA